MTYDISSYLEDGAVDLSDSESIAETSAESTETTSEKTETASDDQGETQSTETSEPSSDLENKLDKLEVESGDGGDLLAKINELNLLRNGMPFEYNDMEKVKEDLMKGFDYTAKTQELAEQRKQSDTEFTTRQESFESERTEFDGHREQFNQALIDNEIMEAALSEMKLNDPDLFQEVSNAFQSHQGRYQQNLNNPEVLALKKQMGEMQASLKQNADTKVAGEDAETNAKWDSGLKETQTAYGAKLRGLGIRPDWNKVQQAWISGDSADTSVKQALLSVHGEQITNALEAKAKALEVKSKSALRQGPAATEQTVADDGAKKGSYFDFAKQYAADKGFI